MAREQAVVQARVEKEEARLWVNAGTAKVEEREQSDEEDMLMDYEEENEADFS